MQLKRKFDEAFPLDPKPLAQGRLKKFFCKPVANHYGISFRNKSEERRHVRLCQPILKLSHLLRNDPLNSHEYTIHFLRQYFEVAEIRQFSNEGLKNLIEYVLDFKEANPNYTMRELILNAMKRPQQTEEKRNCVNCFLRRKEKELFRPCSKKSRKRQASLGSEGSAGEDDICSQLDYVKVEMPRLRPFGKDSQSPKKLLYDYINK